MDVSELFPHVARTRGRHRLRAIGLRPVERPRAGDLRDADRPDPHGVPERGIVGHLRTRVGEREPAGLRRDSRRTRRPARRRQRLELGVHAGRVSGDAVSLDRRSDRRPEAAVRRQRRTAARPARSAGEAERARHAAVSRATPSWRRGSRRTSWRIGCRAARPKRWTSTSESDATRKLYGLDDKITEPFGRQCLMARRLVEHGVRFVQLFHGGMGNQNTRHLGRARRRQGEPHAARRGVGPPDRRPADGPQGARPARFDAGHLARRVRPDADFAARASGATTTRAR